jgi:hypothetical protein
VSLIHDIAPHLVIIAEFLRPDWDFDVLGDAIIAAEMAGWTPGRLVRQVAALIADEDASPWDLKRLAADPFKPAPATTGTGRPKNAEYLAAKAALTAKPPLPEHRRAAS